MWEWISDPNNREIVTWFGSGIVAVVAAIWAVYKYAMARRSSSGEAKRISGDITTVDGLSSAANAKTTQVPGSVTDQQSPVSPSSGSSPPAPSLLVGRENELRELKIRLGISGVGEPPAALNHLTIVRGWPGVGKTTVVSALAHDPEVMSAFPDGTLWTSLGEMPNLLISFASWGRALGIDDLVPPRAANEATAIKEASSRLSSVLQEQRRLLIVDDVWDARHAQPFKVGGRGCAILMTTRETRVAEVLAETPADVYPLNILTEDKAFKLLTRLAPSVVTDHPEKCRELVHVLEGLPLSLQVAGRMLSKDAARGFGVSTLLAELKEGVRLLQAQAPADRAEQYTEVIPSVTVLLKKSTDRLTTELQKRFAMLGPFAPKPATFDLLDLQYQWEVDDARPTINELVDRGLLEPVTLEGRPRYWLHGLLVEHAKWLLQEIEK